MQDTKSRRHQEKIDNLVKNVTINKVKDKRKVWTFHMIKYIKTNGNRKYAKYRNKPLKEEKVKTNVFTNNGGNPNFPVYP